MDKLQQPDSPSPRSRKPIPPGLSRLLVITILEFLLFSVSVVELFAGQWFFIPPVVITGLFFCRFWNRLIGKLELWWHDRS